MCSILVLLSIQLAQIRLLLAAFCTHVEICLLESHVGVYNICMGYMSLVPVYSITLYTQFNGVPSKFASK